MTAVSTATGRTEHQGPGGDLSLALALTQLDALHRLRAHHLPARRDQEREQELGWFAEVVRRVFARFPGAETGPDATREILDALARSARQLHDQEASRAERAADLSRRIAETEYRLAHPYQS